MGNVALYALPFLMLKEDGALALDDSVAREVGGRGPALS